MNRYEDCYRCGAVDGERVFSHDALKVWAFLCPECYELCKHHHKPDHQPDSNKREGHHLTLDDFSDNPTSEQLEQEMDKVYREILDILLRIYK